MGKVWADDLNALNFSTVLDFTDCFIGIEEIRFLK